MYRVDHKTVVHLRNGILHSRKKEGIPTFCDSMDGTGEHYAKWNSPGGERIIAYDLTYKRTLRSKIEPEAWKHGTDWQWPEGRGERDNGGKKGKGLVNKHVWMTYGHRQQCGD